MPDWKAIEADFLATGALYSALAKKWNVPISTLKKRAMRGKWGQKHAVCVVTAEEQVEDELPEEPKVEPEQEVEPVPSEPESKREPLELVPVFPEEVTPEQIAIEKRVDRYKRMLNATDAMMDRVLDAIEMIKPGDTYAMLTLVKALKELREMQGLNKSKLDIEEQRARIAKLKREAEMQDLRGDQSVEIRFIETGEAEL